jgi:hypothetical protein
MLTIFPAGSIHDTSSRAETETETGTNRPGLRPSSGTSMRLSEWEVGSAVVRFLESSATQSPYHHREIVPHIYNDGGAFARTTSPRPKDRLQAVNTTASASKARSSTARISNTTYTSTRRPTPYISPTSTSSSVASQCFTNRSMFGATPITRIAQASNRHDGPRIGVKENPFVTSEYKPSTADTAAGPQVDHRHAELIPKWVGGRKSSHRSRGYFDSYRSTTTGRSLLTLDAAAITPHKLCLEIAVLDPICLTLHRVSIESTRYLIKNHAIQGHIQCTPRRTVCLHDLIAMAFF